MKGMERWLIDQDDLHAKKAKKRKLKAKHLEVKQQEAAAKNTAAAAHMSHVPRSSKK